MFYHHGKRAAVAAVVLSLALLCPPASQGGDEDTPEAKAHELWKEGAGLHLEEQYEAAIDRFNEALALHATGRTHTYLAWSLSELGRYEDAIEHVHKSIELDPDYPNAYNDLGSYLIELKRPGQAIPWLKKAVSMPDYCCPHFSYYQIGRALLMQGKVEASREALRTAVKINPRYRPALRLLRRIRNEGLKGL